MSRTDWLFPIKCNEAGDPGVCHGIPGIPLGSATGAKDGEAGPSGSVKEEGCDMFYQ